MKLEWYAEEQNPMVIRVICEVTFPNGRQGGVAHFVSGQEWRHGGPKQRGYLLAHAVHVMTAGLNRMGVKVNENVA